MDNVAHFIQKKNILRPLYRKIHFMSVICVNQAVVTVTGGTKGFS